MKKWIAGVAALAAAMCFGATTEDGVTKERRGALGPNDTVVTDVDATGIVTARTYTKDEIDRRIETNAPVKSVNGKAGAVTLGANDVGALPNNRTALEGNANFANAVKNVQIVPTVRKIYTNDTEAVATPDGRIDLVLPVAPSSKADKYDPNAEPSHSPFLFPSYYAMWLSFQDVYSWSRDHHRAINDRITQGDSETLAAAKRYTDQHSGGGGGGAVQSVNGKTGEVVLDAAAVEALPDDESGLVEKASFSNAVARVSPPVEPPEKWALANVTNANGQAVGANDVGALPLTGGDMDYATVRGIYGLGGAELGEARILFDSHSTLIKKDDIKWYYGGAEDEDEIAVKGDIQQIPQNMLVKDASGEVKTRGGESPKSMTLQNGGAKIELGYDSGGSWTWRCIYPDVYGMGAEGEFYAVPWAQAFVSGPGFAFSAPDAGVFPELYQFPVGGGGGIIALQNWQSLSRSLQDANTSADADCECISTNIFKLVHSNIVNTVNTTKSRFYDAGLGVEWTFVPYNGEYMFIATTNVNREVIE